MVYQREMVRIRIALLHQEQYLMRCCSFCFAWILWGSKREDSNSPCPAAWRIPSGAIKKRIAMYFCNALFGLMLFWFQNHFSSLSSATSVYCLFAGFSFLSLFIVVRIDTVVRDVGFLFTKASYSIAASDRLCKTCPISALMQTDCRSISCGQTACPWLMQT